MFRKVLFMWWSMPILRFIGYTLTELFKKPDNWQQIYKQTSSTFYTSSNASRRKNLLVSHYRVAKKLFNNSFKKIQKQPPEVFCIKKLFLKISQTSQESTLVGVCFLIKLQAFSQQVFLKKTQVLSYTSAFLWSLRNF